MNKEISTGSKPTILVVDDAPDNIMVLSVLLRDQYKVKVAPNGLKALQVAVTQPPPDLILLDVMMPELDGYETCRRLKADPMTADVPIIFLTARIEPEDEALGLSVGAVDYITKPISPSIVLARVATQLRLRQAQQALKEHNQRLEQAVAERTRDLVRLQEAIILAMASLAESRTHETNNHIRRTQAFVAALARRLQSHPRFSEALSDENIELIRKSAPLHDIGKASVSDGILLKPGKLDTAEFEQVKLHAVFGRDAILAVENALGMSNAFLKCAREIAYSHQEKWDGSGYPQGLAGESIPVAARLMAVADVYDALISRRIYKPAYAHEQAVEIMREGRGTHFDPDIVDAFLAIESTFRQIAGEFNDDPAVE
jgi:putative two-component system response regulator